MPFGLKLLGHSARRSWGVKVLMPSMLICSSSPWHGGEGRGVPTELLFFPLAVQPVNDVACVAVVVDGAASIHCLLSANLSPVPTTRLPAGGMPTGRRGSVAFFGVLY